MEFQYALCVTFFHSLWIGLVVVLLTSLIIVSTKKSSASLRYNLLTGLLFLFVMSMCVVFYSNLGQGAGGAVSGLTRFSFLNTEKSGTGAVLGAGDSSGQDASGLMEGLSTLMNLWTSYSGEMVIIWFLIICIKCVQLLTGLHAVNYLRNNQTALAGNYYEQKVNALSVKLGISKKIRILQSAITKIPVVAGHFKPVILLPLGLLNGLSAAEVEAIISHELAHIKRSDYLVNILQSLVEIVFFFNPAVLWLSNLIKAEREHCCDDLALSCGINKQDYIKALVSCQEFQSDTTGYAMAFSGRKSRLMDRVSRMVLNRSASLNRVEKIVMTLTLISALIFTTAFTESTKKPASAKVPVVPAADHKSYQDSIPKKNTVKKTVSSKTAKTGDSGKSEKKKSQEELRKADVNRQIKAAVQADRERVKNEVLRQQAEKERAVAEREARETPEVPVKPEKPATPEYKSVYELKNAVPAAQKEEAGQLYVVEDDSDPKHITQELINDGLLKNQSNFQYKLDKDELIVDGVRQSHATHQKYAKKYLKNRKGTITTTVRTD